MKSQGKSPSLMLSFHIRNPSEKSNPVSNLGSVYGFREKKKKKKNEINIPVDIPLIHSYNTFK